MRGMMLMVRKAGMALLMLFQSIWAAFIIMRDPVRISAGPVQYTGMDAARTHTLRSCVGPSISRRAMLSAGLFVPVIKRTGAAQALDVSLRLSLGKGCAA